MIEWTDSLNNAHIDSALRGRGRTRAILSQAILARREKQLQAFVAGKIDFENQPRDELYSVSLTSWEKRLDALAVTLLCLISQTVRPRSIFVWLTPQAKRMLQDRITERFTQAGVVFESTDDLRSHKKWLPYIERGHTEPTILADDDILYPSRWFERLVAEDREEAFVAARCHRWNYNAVGLISPYADWEKVVPHEADPSHDLFVTTGGGAVLRPDRIRPKFRDRRKIMALCPKADDIWLKLAHYSAGIPVYKTRFSFPTFEIPGSQENSLRVTNVDQGGNDVQLQALIKAGFFSKFHS